MVHLIRRKSDGAHFALKRVPINHETNEDGTSALNNEIEVL